MRTFGARLPAELDLHQPQRDLLRQCPFQSGLSHAVSLGDLGMGSRGPRHCLPAHPQVTPLPDP